MCHLGINEDDDDDDEGLGITGEKGRKLMKTYLSGLTLRSGFCSMHELTR